MILCDITTKDPSNLQAELRTLLRQRLINLSKMAFFCRKEAISLLKLVQVKLKTPRFLAETFLNKTEKAKICLRLGVVVLQRPKEDHVEDQTGVSVMATNSITSCWISL